MSDGCRGDGRDRGRMRSMSFTVNTEKSGEYLFPTTLPLLIGWIESIHSFMMACPKWCSGTLAGSKRKDNKVASSPPEVVALLLVVKIKRPAGLLGLLVCSRLLGENLAEWGGHTVPRCMEKKKKNESLVILHKLKPKEKKIQKNVLIHIISTVGLESNIFECDSITVQRKIT